MVDGPSAPTTAPASGPSARVAAWPAPLFAARRRLGRHLHGRGVELGPGHQPYEVPADVRVRYVDRWAPDENADLFPELVEIGATDGFVEPDVIANFDTDRLAPLPSTSQDFVICSHVLEHLAEPIGFLGEIYRVLRPGGIALVLLPDRRMTFDRDRPPTALRHLVDEHRAGVTEVADEHVLEFLELAGEGASFVGVPEDADERREFLDWHRRRSIHVHCWSEEEFPGVIRHCIDALHQGWHLVDLLTVAEEGPDSIEFGYVLRRTTADQLPVEAGARFLDDWRHLFDAHHEIDQALRRAAARDPEPPAAPVTRDRRRPTRFWRGGSAPDDH